MKLYYRLEHWVPSFSGYSDCIILALIRLFISAIIEFITDVVGTKVSVPRNISKALDYHGLILDGKVTWLKVMNEY